MTYLKFVGKISATMATKALNPILPKAQIIAVSNNVWKIPSANINKTVDIAEHIPRISKKKLHKNSTI